jgi:hypothetical protein
LKSLPAALLTAWFLSLVSTAAALAGDVPLPVSFRNDVVALLSRAGCNAGVCHGNAAGKGGFALSLRGDDPSRDHLALTHDLFGRRISRSDPPSSLLVLKPTGQVPHEGGPRFAPGSADARILLDWIASGAADDLGSAPRLSRLSVLPAERLVESSSRFQQLVVTAEFDDGSRRDVTALATYDSGDPTRVSVTHSGRVVPSGPLEVTVAVRYLTGRGTSRLAFLPERPDFVWSAPPSRGPVDDAVFDKLRSLKINPSPLAPDAVFLRRAYLDAIGALPTPDESRAFLADTDPKKRDVLIDRLIARPEFADFWALKWADLLRNEEKTMGEKGVWVFQRWLRDQLARDVPFDEFARMLVAARGSTWSNPPANFYRTNRDPQTAAETLSQVFLGVRLQCARCHNHPFDIWTQDDYYGLAAFFANVKRKEIGNFRRDELDKHEINGDEVIYLAGRPVLIQPRSGARISPRAPGAPPPKLDGNIDALDDLAIWLTHDNAQFVRNLVNRVWYHLMGRGIVEPVDDFRESNPPSNSRLLDLLAAEFNARGKRLKPIVAAIMKSTVYQLSSTTNATNSDDDANFSHAAVRLLPGEVLLDAVSQALGQSDKFAFAPRRTRAVQLPGARMGGSFLKIFGKPDRLLTCECERSDATTLAQALQLINGEAVRTRLEAVDNRIGRLLGSGAPDRTLVVDIYLAALCRPPAPDELRGSLDHIGAAADRRRALEDLAWAVVNSKEFLLRH